jgi:hypothetical protein
MSHKLVMKVREKVWGGYYLLKLRVNTTITASAPIATAGSAAPDFVGVDAGVAADTGGTVGKASSRLVVVAVLMLVCSALTGGTTVMT